MADMVQLSTRIDKSVAEQLEQLTARTGHKKVWHVNEALRAYVEQHTAFLEAVETGIAAEEAGDMVEHTEAVATLDAIIDHARGQMT